VHNSNHLQKSAATNLLKRIEALVCFSTQRRCVGLSLISAVDSFCDTMLYVKRPAHQQEAELYMWQQQHEDEFVHEEGDQQAQNQH
jgi:hypothetical protein